MYSTHNMLICEIKDTKQRLSADKNKSVELKDLSKNGLLKCPIPICNREVIFKCGSKKMPHFAHKIHCVYPDHEPESQEHLTGKTMLERVLTRLFPESKVEIEAWIKETNQEADVLVTQPNGSRLAFEFQCSKISGSKWEARHLLYKSADIKDCWILNSNLKKKSIAKDTEDFPRWLLCDLAVTIFNKQSKFEELKSPFANNTDSNYILFYDLDKQSFVISYGGYIEGRSLEFAKEEMILSDKITLSEGEFRFPKFEKHLSDISEREKNYLLQKIRDKEEGDRRTRERLEEEKDEKKKQEIYLKNQEWKTKRFEEEQKKEEKLFQNRINGIDRMRFESDHKVKTYMTIKCPSCERRNITHGNMILRQSYKELFFGCTNFPKYCHFANSVENTLGLHNPFVQCRECGNHMYLTKNGVDIGYSWICSSCNRTLPVYFNINTFDDLDSLKDILSKKNIQD